MNITFLVGNGFDLNLGLKTKYEDFLHTYTEKNEYANQYVINDDALSIFRSDILKNFDEWSSAEEAFGQYTAKFANRKRNADEFSECHEDFCSRLAEYLNDQQKSFDIESQKENIAKEFAASISFDNLVNNFRENQRQQLQNSAKSIGGAYNYNFINFNYTITLDKFVDFVRENSDILGMRTLGGTGYKNRMGEIIHVHGYTDRDMVLGVNDTSQIISLELFNGYGDEFLNQFIKQKTNEMNEENVDVKTHELLKKSDLIYIYGMSTGKTDALWWQRIIQIMLNRKNVHTIIHCFDRPSNLLIRRKIQTFDKHKKLEFLSYSDISEDKKDDIMNRIHIDGNNIFAALKDMAVNTSIDSSVEQQEEKVLVNVWVGGEKWKNTK